MALSDGAIYQYWGKAGTEAHLHLLPYRCLDVAACGITLLGYNHPLRDLLTTGVKSRNVDA